jgi:hypothetical protein
VGPTKTRFAKQPHRQLPYPPHKHWLCADLLAQHSVYPSQHIIRLGYIVAERIPKRAIPLSRLGLPDPSEGIHRRVATAMRKGQCFVSRSQDRPSMAVERIAKRFGREVVDVFEIKVLEWSYQAFAIAGGIGHFHIQPAGWPKKASHVGQSRRKIANVLEDVAENDAVKRSVCETMVVKRTHDPTVPSTTYLLGTCISGVQARQIMESEGGKAVEQAACSTPDIQDASIACPGERTDRLGRSCEARRILRRAAGPAG